MSLKDFAHQYGLRLVADDFDEPTVVLAGAIICEAGTKLLFCPTRYPSNWHRISRRLQQMGFRLEQQDNYSEEWSFDPSDGIAVRVLFETIGMIKVLRESALEPRERLEARLSRPEPEEDLGGPELRLSPGCRKSTF